MSDFEARKIRNRDEFWCHRYIFFRSERFGYPSNMHFHTTPTERLWCFCLHIQHILYSVYSPIAAKRPINYENFPTLSFSGTLSTWSLTKKTSVFIDLLGCRDNYWMEKRCQRIECEMWKYMEKFNFHDLWVVHGRIDLGTGNEWKNFQFSSSKFTQMEREIYHRNCFERFRFHSSIFELHT